ncbi:DUF998 domain-containing protein [Streptomyces sp. NPDC020742]|uniref:DUF998 domain-containing protein n=1 Tax=Streptomyces sp. NPDC020742 TaxID=3154897 RepID=UPI0033F1ED9A
MRATVRAGAASALLFAVAAVLYNGWLLEFWLPTGLDPRHSYVSELYAADQPYRPLFGGIESCCAVLVVLAALLVYGRTAGGWSRAGRLALVGFGLSSLADVMLPMRCAPSLEPGCEAVHPWHTVTSALAHFFLFASMVLLSRAAAADGAGLPLIRRWGLRVLAVAMPAAICTVGPLFGLPGWHGVPQRLHLLLVGVWFALLAAELARGSLYGRGLRPEVSDGGARQVGDGAVRGGVAHGGVVCGGEDATPTGTGTTSS